MGSWVRVLTPYEDKLVKVRPGEPIPVDGDPRNVKIWPVVPKWQSALDGMGGEFDRIEFDWWHGEPVDHFISGRAVTPGQYAAWLMGR